MVQHVLTVNDPFVMHAHASFHTENQEDICILAVVLEDSLLQYYTILSE